MKRGLFSNMKPKLPKGDEYKFGKPIKTMKSKKPTPKPKSALQKTRELLKLKQESLTQAYKINDEIAKERDYWMFKKQPRGFFKKLLYLIKH